MNSEMNSEKRPVLRCKGDKGIPWERAMYSVAAKIPVEQWDSWLYCKILESDTCDGYFVSFTDILEHVKTEMLDHSLCSKEDLPNIVWTCDRRYMPLVDARDVAKMACEDLYDGAADEVDPASLKALDKALAKFNAANKHICGYVPNYFRAVVIDWGKYLS